MPLKSLLITINTQIMTMKTHFVFNAEWYEIIKDCSNEVKGEVFSAVMEYAVNGIILEVSREAKIIFSFIKREIDRRSARRQKERQRRITVSKSDKAAPPVHKETISGLGNIWDEVDISASSSSDSSLDKRHGNIGDKRPKKGKIYPVDNKVLNGYVVR